MFGIPDISSIAPLFFQLFTINSLWILFTGYILQLAQIYDEVPSEHLFTTKSLADTFFYGLWTYTIFVLVLVLENQNGIANGNPESLAFTAGFLSFLLSIAILTIRIVIKFDFKFEEKISKITSPLIRNNYFKVIFSILVIGALAILTYLKHSDWITYSIGVLF